MTKPLLIVILVACGGPSPASDTSPTDPEDQPLAPPDLADDPSEDQHFCCQSVDLEKWTGDDCVPIDKSQIALCGEVLYCPGLWGKSAGVTKCK